MFYYFISIIIPIGMSYYNYLMYKKLEKIYNKLHNMNKKLNYYLTYQYVEPINPYSDIILSSSTNEYTLPHQIDLILDNNYTNCNNCTNDVDIEKNQNKIYLVL